MKKVIGIISKPKMKKNNKIWNKMYIADELRYLIVKNGGIAISILSTEETMVFNQNDLGDKRKLSQVEIQDLEQVISTCDGIILQGGICSCSYEVECVKIAMKLDKPILGICAGFNNILRALGSDVVVDDTNTHYQLDVNYRHKININKNTMLYNIIEKDNIEVNSIHSMIATEDAINKIGIISAKSEDNLVECFEIPRKKMVMGIKWHPELMLESCETDKLISYFINCC